MANVDTFKDAVINEDEHVRSMQAEAGSKKCHLNPNEATSLENLYDLQERFQGPRNSKTHSSTMMHELINLRIEQDLKFVNLSTCCTHQ